MKKYSNQQYLIRKFLRKNCHLFKFVDNVSRLHSKVFLLFLICVLPTNIYILASLKQLYQKYYHNNTTVSNDLFFQTLFFIICCSLQITGMFVIHYICTKYSKHIHTNGTKQFMFLNTIMNNNDLFNSNHNNDNNNNVYDDNVEKRERQKRNYDLNFHWKQCLHIEKFHTKNHYGFTYGRFGVISMVGFVRFLMIYAKMAMVTYKMTNL
ncbi:uncharacterized protein LOC113793771 [Dermatophagoides pteronyssinus]|uniref:uncharacterized protein LOC113793771 n=1 Tax=Dermatophagoides pteronyssinus TaxID=6956 RepID=UPI003F66C817